MSHKDPLVFFRLFSEPNFISKMWKEWRQSPHPQSSEISDYLGHFDLDERIDPWNDVYDEEKDVMYLYYTDPANGKTEQSSGYYFKDFLKKKIDRELENAKDTVLSEMTIMTSDLLNTFSNGLDEQCTRIINIVNINPRASAFPFINDSVLELRRFIKSTILKIRDDKSVRRQKRRLNKKIFCKLNGKPFTDAVDEMVVFLEDKSFVKKTRGTKASFQQLLHGESVKVPIPWQGTFEELRTFFRELGETPAVTIPHQGKLQIIEASFSKDGSPITVEQIQRAKYIDDETRQTAIRNAVKPFSPISTIQKKL